MTETTIQDSIEDRAARVYQRVKANAEGLDQELGPPIAPMMLTGEIARELRALEQAVTQSVTQSISERAAAAVTDLMAKVEQLEAELAQVASKQDPEAWKEKLMHIDDETTMRAAEAFIDVIVRP